MKLLVSNFLDLLFKKFSPYQLTTATKKKKLKIAIGVLISGDRPEYLDISLNSLFKSKTENLDVTFLLLNHGSKNKNVEKIIAKKRNKKYKILRTYEENQTRSWGEAFNKATKFLINYDDFDIIGTCDSDVIYHERWLIETIKNFLWIKKNHKNHILGAFSSFNSSDYPYHKVLGKFKGKYGEYWVKERMGGLNYFYFTKDLLKLGFFSENKHDELLMTKKFKKYRIRNFSTANSFVDHIGEKSILDDYREKKVGELNYVYGLNYVDGNWNIPNNLFKEKSFDLVMPFHIKDLPTVKLSLEMAKKYLNIRNIYLITNKNNFSKIKNKDVILVDENKIFKDLNINKIKSIWKEKTGEKHLSVTPGWAYQQFIKFEVARKIKSISDFYLILDSDTIFLNKIPMFDRNKMFLTKGKLIHKPYFDMISKVWGIEKKSKISYISHHMIVNKSIVKEIIKQAESKHKKKWYMSIIDNYDFSIHSGFSEYETYGLFVEKNYYNSYKLRTLINKDLRYLPTKKDLKKLSKKYNCVSSHEHARK
jgi:hypothetical protein